MKTKLLYGNSKYSSLKQICEELRKDWNNDDEFVFIVPDKFSVNAEKLIMESLNLKSTFNINVTSFDRMADEFVQQNNMTYLNKICGIMLVQKLLLEHQSELQVFKKNIEFCGLSENIYEHIMLLRSCNITPQELANSAKSMQDFSGIKVNELAFVYNLYEDACKDRFFDSANKLDILCDALPFSQKYFNTHFYFAMFDDYTPQSLRVLKELQGVSKGLTFGLVASREKDKFDFYDETATNKIRSLFDNCDVEEKNVSEKYVGSKLVFEHSWGRGDELANCADSHFVQANTVQEEIEFVATSISNKTRNGERFRNFNVAVCNLGDYKCELTKIFNQYDIPFFIDASNELLQLSLTKFIFSILDCIDNHMQNSNIMAVLYSPFFVADRIEKMKFENFVLANNLQREQILDLSNYKNCEDATISIATQLKNQLDFILEGIKQAFTIFDYCTLLKEFLVQFQLEDVNASIVEFLEKSGEKEMASLNEQSFDLFFNLLEQMIQIFNVSPTSFEQFYSLLQNGCSSVQVRSAPTSVDCVFVGDENSSIFASNDYLYILNCVENNFPTLQKDTGLLSDDEIEKINNFIVLEPSIRAINKKNYFITYNNLFAFEKEIYFSYALCSLSKHTQKPSTFLLCLKNKFGKNVDGVMQTCEFMPIALLNDLSISNLQYFCVNDYSAQKILASSIFKHNLNFEQRKMLASLFVAMSKKNVDLEETIYKAREKNVKGTMKNSQKSIEQKGNVSVTQVETFMKCPYVHFMKYVLRLREKQSGELKSIDIGNFFHKVAEKLFTILQAKGLKYCQQENLEEFVDEIVKGIERQEDFVRFFMKLETDLILQGVEMEAKRMCYALNERAKNCEFSFTNAEYKFSINLRELGCEIDCLKMKGSIDRVDEYNNYFRVIDYKSGQESYEESQLYYGTKIQLQLYSYIYAQQSGKSCAGLYYMPLKDDFINSNTKLKNVFYRLDGRLLDDASLALAQDTTLCLEKLQSEYIPVVFKKSELENGEYSFNTKSSRVLTKQQMRAELEYARKLFCSAVNDMVCGFIEPTPFVNDNISPCDYCAFKVGCGFEEKCGNKKREKVKKIDYIKTFEEIINKNGTKKDD